MERLKYNSNPRATKARERIFAKLAELDAIDFDRAGVWLFKAAITIKWVDLPEPEGPIKPAVSPTIWLVRSL